MKQRGSPVAPRRSTTFLFCIESGYFEAQTLLAVECLRQFGGRFANAPVMVVTPRLGPPLTPHTLSRLAELSTTYVRWTLRNRYNWYPYTNKALAALVAEELATTDQVIWLDSDVLVVAEPDRLELGPEESFAICAFDKNIGSSGPGDRNEAYWKALADYYGISVEQLPWVETEFDRQRVRFRLSSGVYSFRRGVNLGEAFVRDVEGMFSSRIAYTRRVPFPGDDVALAFAVVRLGLPWRLLPRAYHTEIGPGARGYRREELSSAKILRYNHALASSEGCLSTLKELEVGLPHVAAWLRLRIPLERRTGGLPHMLMRRALREWRHLRSARHEAACRITVQD
jgi:hypothetical protein